MAQTKKPSMAGYYAAINWLYDNRPHMVEYITSLGAPKNDIRCDRAMVVAGPDMKPKLYASDEFLQKIGPAQAAGVLVHEWRHVLLDHFSETLHPKPHWKYPIVVRDAQEATINDSIELTGYELPDDVIRGENRGGEFYGYWTTDEAYGPMEEWYLSQKKNPQAGDDEDSAEEDSEEGSDDQQSGGGSTSGSGSSSDSGSDSGSDSQPSDGAEEDQGDDASTDASSGQSPATAENDGSPKASDGAPDGTTDGAEAEPGDGEEAEGEDAEASDSGDQLDENASSDGCKHGAFIEDENGDLREMDEDELERFVDELNKVIADAINANPMPEDERPTDDELDSMDQDVAAAVDPDRNKSYSKAGIAPGAAEQVLAGGKLQLGWLKLLQRINPDVGKDGGGLNAKASYNWARTRRTTSLIPGVNLPTPGAPRGIGAGARQKPVALIALDFSGSIDRRLAFAMKDMAQSIPEEHIEARCFTFSTVAVPFDFRAKSNQVASGGTDFSCIELEARKIKKETGEYPYVICLTDGEAWFESYGYGGYGGYGNSSSGSEPSPKELASRWLWVDVETEDDTRAFLSGKAYPQVKAQPNKSALPYDRSKL